jgi:adenylosuccinate synthase
VEAELEYYKGIREEILAMTIDTIEYSNQALKDGKSILIEGANATSTYSLPCFECFFQYFFSSLFYLS